MTLVDSSVWIALFRGTDNQAVRRLIALTQAAGDRVLVGDLIVLEVLQGARDDSHAASLERILSRFASTRLLDQALAVAVARNFRVLRGLGVTVRRTVDLVIGTFCIEEGHDLLQDDRDFTLMARHLPLKLA